MSIYSLFYDLIYKFLFGESTNLQPFQESALCLVSMLLAVGILIVFVKAIYKFLFGWLNFRF